MIRPDHYEQTLIAAGISLLAEAVAVVLFIAMVAVWAIAFGGPA